MEYGNKPFDIFLRRVLPPNLRVKPVVPKCIIGRACNAAIHAFVGQFPKSKERVAVDDNVRL